jgi:hypothetical protein
MKKNLMIAALAALSIGSASAQTIYITGSTAFRTAANKALFSALGTNNIAATDQSSRDGSSAGNLLFTNVTVNGSTVDVVVAWSGSELGIRTVASGTNNLGIPFYSKEKMASNGITFPATSMAGGDMNTLVVNSNTVLAKGDIAFSDTYQGASVYPAGGVGPDGYTYKSLTGTKVGVVPFTFAASKNFPVQEMTTSIFDDLAKNGNTTLNQFNGDTTSSGTNAKVWLMGRNPDSGTRVTTLMVAKTGRTTALTQWKPTASSGIITAMAKTAATTNYGIVISAGNSGEASGSTLCGYMTNVFASNVAVSGASRGGATNYAVCYASVSQAISKYTNGLVPLRYNGVAGRHFTTNLAATVTTNNLDEGYTNVISGKYSFWSYEQIMWDPLNTNSFIVSNLVSSLENFITNISSTNTLLAPNISLSEMKVKRTSDVGAITPK